MSGTTSPGARLVAIVVIQIAILFSILAFSQYTVWTSDTIHLRVDTTNPQSLVGPQSIPLRLDISRIDVAALPGDDRLDSSAFVELQEGEGGIWEPVAIHERRTHLFSNTVVLEADFWYILATPREPAFEFHFGIENVYMDERTTSVPAGNDHEVALEVRVDRFGDATPLRFLIDGQPFELKQR